MEHILNHKAPWSSSKLLSSHSSSAWSAERSFQSRVFTFNDNKENGAAYLQESSKTPFISPSPSKMLERKRSYQRSSTDRKEAYAFELDSVKKTLRFESQGASQAEIYSLSVNSRRTSDTFLNTSGKKNKINVLKMR